MCQSVRGESLFSSLVRKSKFMNKLTMNKFSTTVEEREKQCHVVRGTEVLEFFNKTLFEENVLNYQLPVDRLSLMKR